MVRGAGECNLLLYVLYSYASSILDLMISRLDIVYQFPFEDGSTSPSAVVFAQQ